MLGRPRRAQQHVLVRLTVIAGRCAGQSAVDLGAHDVALRRGVVEAEGLAEPHTVHALIW